MIVWPNKERRAVERQSDVNNGWLWQAQGLSGLYHQHAAREGPRSNGPLGPPSVTHTRTAVKAGQNSRTAIQFMGLNICQVGTNVRGFSLKDCWNN